MSTIVGTNIEVTNLKYDSDTTSMIISNTGQVTIQGEGTATTNLQQGLAKAWVIEDHNTSNEIKDSFNIGSVTDTGTGVSQFFYTNNMVGSEYCPVSGMSSGVYNGACNMPANNGGDTAWGLATTYWYHSTRGNGGASGANTGINLYDCERVAAAIHGDLA